MSSHTRAAGLVLMELGLGMLLSWALPAAALPSPATQARLSAVYGNLPLSFEANEGQADKTVKFLSRGQGYTLLLTSSEAVLSLSRPQHEATVIRMQVAGGKRAPQIVGLDPRPAESNYFLGNDPNRWHTGVPQYARVRYEDVYPGVDLIYRGNRRQLEYDLVVAPHADPGRIRLTFRGADEMSIGPQGDLILHTASGDLVQHAPEVYQEAEGRRQRVEGHYTLDAPQPNAPRQVGFAVGRYDHTRPLVIDPVVVYSTFLGGSGVDESIGMAVDAAGNAYVTGRTDSSIFPGVNGSSLQPTGGGSGDAFVMKINPSGTAIVYSTFLGGSGADEGFDIAVDSGGNVYITGDTTSTAFPGVHAGSLQPAHGGGVDAFVTQLDPTGAAIVYSTFLGGSQDDLGKGIAVDNAGNAYVAGVTSSPTFPGVTASSIQPANAGNKDAFVTKINASGTATVYSTFLGGSGFEQTGGLGGSGLAVDGAGNAYVTGATSSLTFPGVGAGSIQPTNGGGGEDAFVTKINPSGTAIVYSTFLGGSGLDQGFAIAADSAGNAYVTGSTAFSPTFPGVNGSSLQPSYGGGIGDAFVTKINPLGTAIVYSTFLGGSSEDQGNAIAVDSVGNAYVTGVTQSFSFPGVDGSSIQPANGGGATPLDGFVTKINPTGTAIVYSTFLGGDGFDVGIRIAVDRAGNAYVAGATGSSTFPGISGSSLQPTKAGGLDGFVMKISGDALTPLIPALDPRGLGLLALLLAASGLLALRKRRAR